MEPAALAALASRLEALDYAVPPTGLDPDTAPLLERLVRDLVQTADAYRTCKTRAAKQATELESWRDKVDALRQENARVMKENTALHQSAIHAAEAAERRERALRAELRELHAVGRETHGVAGAAPRGDESSAQVCTSSAETGRDNAVAAGAADDGAAVAEELAAERERVARRDAEIQRLSKALECAIQQQQHQAEDGDGDVAAGPRGSGTPDASTAAGDGALVASLRRESDALRARVRELTNALAAAKRRNELGGPPPAGGSGGPILALSVGSASSSSRTTDADADTPAAAAPAAAAAAAVVAGEQLSQCLRQLASTQAALERTRGERDAARRMLDAAVAAAQQAAQRHHLGAGSADGDAAGAAAAGGPAVTAASALQFALDEADARAQAACDARDRALARAAAAEAALRDREGGASTSVDARPVRVAPSATRDVFSANAPAQDAGVVISQLRSLLATADATREQLVTKLRSSLAACHAAEQRCTQAQARAQEAAHEVAQLRALAASLADERDALSAQLAAAQDQHQGLDALAATHGFAAAAARDAASVAERSLAQAREQAASAARDCAALRAAVADARAAADAALADARQLRASLEASQQEAAVSKAEAAAAVAASQGAQAVALAKSRELDDVTEAFSQLSGEHATLCMSLSALQREHEQAHHALSAAHEALDAASLRLAELQDDNAALRAQLADVASYQPSGGERSGDAALVARLRAAEARAVAAERAREEAARDAAAAGATCEALRCKLEELVMAQHTGVDADALQRRVQVLAVERDEILEEVASLRRQLAQQNSSTVHGPGTPEELRERSSAMRSHSRGEVSVTGGDSVSEGSAASAPGGGHASDDLRAENAALRERLRRTEAAAAEAALEMERVQQEYSQLAFSLAEASQPLQ